MTDHAHHVPVFPKENRIDGVHIRSQNFRLRTSVSSKRVTIVVSLKLPHRPEGQQREPARTPPSAFLFLSLQLSNSHIFRCREPEVTLQSPLDARHQHTPTNKPSVPNPSGPGAERPISRDASAARPHSVAASPCVGGLIGPTVTTTCQRASVKDFRRRLTPTCGQLVDKWVGSRCVSRDFRLLLSPSRKALGFERTHGRQSV